RGRGGRGAPRRPRRRPLRRDRRPVAAEAPVRALPPGPGRAPSRRLPPRRRLPQESWGPKAMHELIAPRRWHLPTHHHRREEIAMERPLVILFDIDGTLITTGGAGAVSWRRAFE